MLAPAAILIALCAGVIVGLTQSNGVALFAATIIGLIGLGLRDRAASVLDLATRPAVRLSRAAIWLETLATAAVCGAVVFCLNPATGPTIDYADWNLLSLVVANTRIVAAAFVAGIVALFALSILSVSGFRSDPWKPRDDRFGRTLARSASGGLLALALLSTPAAFFVPYVVVLFLLAATLILGLRQFRRRRSRLVELPPDELAFLADESLSDETRAELVRRMIGDAVSSQDTRLGDWLPVILARPMGPMLEAALFSAMALAPSEVSEPLLAKLLADPSPMVQSKVAHLLAWFGTPKTIESLRAVKGPGTDAAQAAVARIKSRSLHAEEGRLSIAEPASAGALSVLATGGLSLAEREARTARRAR